MTVISRRNWRLVLKIGGGGGGEGGDVGGGGTKVYYGLCENSEW